MTGADLAYTFCDKTGRELRKATPRMLRDDFQSSVIAWLKILLPLAALALLSTMFMLSRNLDHSGTIPFADRDLAQRASDEQVTAPYFAGATPDGALVSMTATRARPDPSAPGRATAEGVWTRIDFDNGSVLSLRAEEALIDEPEDRAELRGTVRIESSNGYVVTTDAVVAAIRSVSAETLGPVHGKGPAGTLEAGKLRIESDEKSGSVQLVFTDGVKLVYRPNG